MVWVDRLGEATPLDVPPGAIEDVAVSPDGDRLALAVFDQGLVGLHVHELATGTTAQVTFDNFDSYPVWSPDGLELAFTSTRLGPWDVFRAPVDRSREPEAVLTRPTDQIAMSWSPDGRSILYKDDYASLERIALEEGTISDGPEVTQIGTASYSPDGRWIAYSTNESGVQQLRLARVGETGSRLLAGGGADLPAWSDDGDELFFTGTQCFGCWGELPHTEDAHRAGRNKNHRARWSGNARAVADTTRGHGVGAGGGSRVWVRADQGAGVLGCWFPLVRVTPTRGREAMGWGGCGLLHQG